MHIPTLATIRSHLRFTRTHEAPQRTHRERIVAFWVQVVVGTFVGLCLVTGASLSLLFVHPAAQAERQLSEDEMFQQENPDDYNGAAAEALLRAYDARRRAATPATTTSAAEVAPAEPTKDAASAAPTPSAGGKK